MRCFSFRRIFCALVMLLGCTQFATANLLVNGGFETPVNTTGSIPSTCGTWEYNTGQSTGAVNGVTPYEGFSMLQFIFTNPGRASGISADCDIFQLVDVSGYTSAIRAGLARATLSGYFDRIAGDAGTDTLFAINFWAYAGAPSSFNNQIHAQTELGSMECYLFTDADPKTWELALCTMFLPAATDFVAVRIAAVENIRNDGAAPEFDGHYADYITLTLETVPEPMSLAVLGLGLGAILSRKVRAARRS